MSVQDGRHKCLAWLDLEKWKQEQDPLLRLGKGPPREDFKDRGGRKIGGCVGELGLSSGFYTSLQ